MKWDLLINGNPDQQAEMTVVQDAWEKYGLKLEICTMDPQTCISEILEENVDIWMNGGSFIDSTGLHSSLLNWVTINDGGNYGVINNQGIK